MCKVCGACISARECSMDRTPWRNVCRGNCSHGISPSSPTNRHYNNNKITFSESINLQIYSDVYALNAFNGKRKSCNEIYTIELKMNQQNVDKCMTVLFICPPNQTPFYTCFAHYCTEQKVNNNSRMGVRCILYSIIALNLLLKMPTKWKFLIEVIDLRRNWR